MMPVDDPFGDPHARELMQAFRACILPEKRFTVLQQCRDTPTRDVIQAMSVALQPIVTAFAHWYTALPYEVQALLTGRALNRRRVMRRQRMRRYRQFHKGRQ